MSRSVRLWIFGLCLGGFALQSAGQGAPQQAPAAPAGLGNAGQAAPQGGRGNRGGGRGAGAPAGAAAPAQQAAPTTSFPAQQRPPSDPAVVARGTTLYGMHCRSCHGADMRGGDQGGPNLLRSQLVLNDQAGELIIPVVREGRRNPGMGVMLPLTLPDDDIKAIAEYIHSLKARSAGQGGPPPREGPAPVLNVLVGDARAGEAYFAAKCASCHSVTGDLKGIGARTNDPTQLQNLWIGGGGGRGNAGLPTTVTLANGTKIEGTRERIDDFIVVLRLPDGTSRSFRRDGDSPKIEIRDSLAGHRSLLPVYTDKDIHDVTAFLVTLK